jgi:hypothetical protein
MPAILATAPLGNAVEDSCAVHSSDFGYPEGIEAINQWSPQAHHRFDAADNR